MDKIIIYQVLARLWGEGRFSDWDDAAFAHLRRLGVTHIWYTGLPRHASGKDFVKGDWGSPYAVSNWYDTNPYLADNPCTRISELKHLIKHTHEAGFAVITDLIPNHVAADQPSICSGLHILDRCDYDWTDTRKVDYSSRGTWEAMLDIVLHWADMGVDGMRCDMVELVPPDFFRWLIAAVKEKHPGFIFIAEVYGRESYRRYLDEVGFDLLYDKSGLYDRLRGIIRGQESARAITWNWQSLSDMQAGMLNFLENHDEQRVASEAFAGTAQRAYAALAVSALFNDASFMLYFGQEFGESAPEAADGRTSIFNHITVRSIGDFKRKGLSSEQKSVLKRYREVLNLASRLKGWNNWDLCYCNSPAGGFDPDRHFAFLRFKGRRAFLVVCNFSSKTARISVNVPAEAFRTDGPVVTETAPFDYSVTPLCG